MIDWLIKLVFFVGMIIKLYYDIFIIINLILTFLLNVFRGRLNFKGIPIIIIFFTIVLIPPVLLWEVSDIKRVSTAPQIRSIIWRDSPALDRL